MSTTDFFIGAIVVGVVIAIVAFSIRKNSRHAAPRQQRAGDNSADPTGAGSMPLWMGADTTPRPGHSHAPGPHAGHAHHGHHGHNCGHGCTHDAAPSDSCAPVDSAGGFDTGGGFDGGSGGDGGGGGGGDGGGGGGGGGD